MSSFKCVKCSITKDYSEFDSDHEGVPLIHYCKSCSDDFLIEDVMVTCSICKESKPSSSFQHYRTRFKKNGMRLRVNTNCGECAGINAGVVARLRKANPEPAYLTECPLCERIVYEKAEDIPQGVTGTNGPWQCDHDHETDEFRGYICKPCNVGVSGDLPAYQRNAPAWKGKDE